MVERAATVWRVLVVDEDPGDRELLKALLGRQGHTVAEANDGGEALASGAHFRPHIILLDLQMPAFDGYELCQAIRSEPWGRQCAIYAVTGFHGTDNLARSRAAGFDGIFLKPLTKETLEQLLPR